MGIFSSYFFFIQSISSSHHHGHSTGAVLNWLPPVEKVALELCRLKSKKKPRNEQKNILKNPFPISIFSLPDSFSLMLEFWKDIEHYTTLWKKS